VAPGALKRQANGYIHPKRGHMKVFSHLADALVAAHKHGHAVVKINPDGLHELHTFDEGVPSLEQLQNYVGGLIEPVTVLREGERNPALYDGPIMAYANEEAWAVPDRNLFAEVVLNRFSSPFPVFGPVALLVGFGIDENGDTVRADLNWQVAQ